jgi:hypothetical protein
MITTNIETITPVQARRVLDTMNTHNRPLVMARVEDFARQMRAGRWQVTHQGLAFDVNGVLLDGQHRLAAVYAANVPVDMMVTTGLPPESFSTMDAGAKRTAAHVLAIQGSRESTLMAGAVKVILSYREAMQGQGTFQALLGNRVRSNAEILKAYETMPGLIDLAPAARQVQRVTALASPAAVLGALYQFALGHPVACQGFIHGITTGAGLNEGDPRLTLRNRAASGNLTKRAGTAAQVYTFQLLQGAFRAHLLGKPWAKAQIPQALLEIGPTA